MQVRVAAACCVKLYGMDERINESCAQSAVVTFIVIMLPLILLVSCGR